MSPALLEQLRHDAKAVFAEAHRRGDTAAEAVAFEVLQLLDKKSKAVGVGAVKTEETGG